MRNITEEQTRHTAGLIGQADTGLLNHLAKQADIIRRDLDRAPTYERWARPYRGRVWA